MATYVQLTSTNPKTITSATAESGVSISGMPAANFDWLTIYVSVYGLDSGATARISIDVSVDAGDTWNSIWVSPETALIGPIGSSSSTLDTDFGEGESTAFYTNPMQLAFRPFRDSRPGFETLCSIGTPSGSGVVGEGFVNVVPWGISGGLIRVNVYSLTGSSPHLTYQSWMVF
jgi:hypothetical protein